MLDLAGVLEEVRCRQPLVQCITNFVTVNDCANIILASGGSPTMCMDIREAAEAVAQANALVCNLGAIEHVDSMIAAGRRANELGIPVVLDPVAAGGTEFRRRESARLLGEVRFAAIRGNASEIRALAGQASVGSGVDVAAVDAVTEKTLPQAAAVTAELARRTGSVIAMSGVLDIVSDGARTAVVRNGCATMARITGSGCMATSLMGAFCAGARPDYFAGAVATMAAMGLCGEIAEARRLANGTGNATFRTDLIDAVFTLTGERLERGARYELYEG